MRTALAIALLFVTAAHADTLFDLKSAVSRLSATQPVRGTFSRQSNTKTSGRWANHNDAHSASIEVAHEAAGVILTIPQALLEKAAAEEQARNGAWNNSASSAISQISTLAVARALDARSTILGLLNLGTRKSESRVMYQGHSVRLLVLTLHQPMTKSEGVEIGSLKTDQDELSVWIADDNLPLAAERLRSTTAGFMMFKGHETEKTTYTFAQTADRLVLARMERTGKGSGMGQNFQGTDVETLTLH
jgi:hypothetical protein